MKIVFSSGIFHFPIVDRRNIDFGHFEIPTKKQIPLVFFFFVNLCFLVFVLFEMFSVFIYSSNCFSFSISVFT